MAGETPDLVFSTHMDTVHLIFVHGRRGVYVWRGVSDAKGIIAAQVAAAEALRRRIADWMLFVSGEERDSAGRRRKSCAQRQPFLINGEPTDNRLALASKGALRAVFKAAGKMCHSAYPELAKARFTSWWMCWARCWRFAANA